MTLECEVQMNYIRKVLTLCSAQVKTFSHVMLPATPSWIVFITFQGHKKYSDINRWGVARKEIALSSKF